MDNLGQVVAEQLITELTQTIALYPGAFKPSTKAHFDIVKRISPTVDEVHVIIANNVREGYTPELSLKIWEQYKKLLPNNVKVYISKDPSPITEVYSVVKDKSNNYVVVYGKGEQDRYNSINENRDKYSNVDVVDAGQIGDISATKLREAIKTRNKLAIKSLIPEGIKVNDFLINFQIHEIKVNQPKTLNFPINLDNQEKAIEVGKKLFNLDYYWLNDRRPDWTNAPFKTPNFEPFNIFLVNDNKKIIDYEYTTEIDEDKIPGGLAKGKSIVDLAIHHGDDSWASIQFESLEAQLKKQLEKGIKVEMEHTTSKEVAKEIAMDHLWEDPKYYNKLASIEEIKINKPVKLWKFDTELKIGDRVKIPQKFMEGDVFVYLGGDILKDEKSENTYSIKAMKRMYDWDLEQIKNGTQTQIIDESKNLGTLYHFTNLQNASNIIKSNQIVASTTESSDYQRDFQFFKKKGQEVRDKGLSYLTFVSLTRDKLFYKKRPKISSAPIVRFELDGNKLSSKYKIKPFNYYADEIENETDRFYSNEGEERVNLYTKGEISNLDRYTTRICVLLDFIEDNESYLKQAKELISTYPGKVISLYKEKPMSIEDYEKNVLPTIEPYRDEEFLEEAKNSIKEALDEIKVKSPHNNLSVDNFIELYNKLNVYYSYEIRDLINTKYGYIKTEGLIKFYERQPLLQKVSLMKDMNILNKKSKENLLNTRELNESIQINPKKYVNILNKLAEECCRELEIQKPNIILINNDKYTLENKSYGGYFPGKDLIKLVIYGRLLKDACVTLVHELRHHYQYKNNLIKSGDGKDGDEIENDSNSFAGSYLRKFGRNNPEIYFTRYDKN